MSPFPGITAASMYMRSPPTAVHERPATTPGISSPPRRSVFAPSYRGGPKTFAMSSRVTVGTPSSPRASASARLAGCTPDASPAFPPASYAEAACTAAARQSASKHRCKPRTPASRVYPRTIVSIASSGIRSFGSGRARPCSSRTRGAMCVAAILCFSSAVYPGTSIISMRSRSGPGMVRPSLAVARNVTRERSNGTPR